MKEIIKINGVDHPLAFSVYFRTECEFDLGLRIADVDTLPEAKRERAFLKVLYWALVDGARVHKVKFTLTYVELLEALEGDVKIAEQFNDILTKKNEQSKKVAATSKK